MQLALIQFKTGCKCPEKLLILHDDPISDGHRYTRPLSAGKLYHCTEYDSAKDQATGRSDAVPVRVIWTRQGGVQQALGK